MDVIVLDSFDDFYDPSVKHSNLRTCGESVRFNLATGDIRDEAAVEATPSGAGIEMIVHLAARAEPGYDPTTTFDVRLEQFVRWFRE